MRLFALGLLVLFCQCQLRNRALKERPPVVILDLVPSGATAAQAEHYSDLIRASMISTEEFRVIERDTVRRKLALRELTLQQSGMSEELGEVGRNLNARLMFTGTLRKTNTYFIVLNAIDIETLEVVTSGVARAPNEGALEAEIFRMTRRLIARIKGKSESDVVISENYAKVRDAELSGRLPEGAREVLAVPGAFLEEHKTRINYVLPGFKHAKSGHLLTGLFFLGSFSAAANTAYTARMRYDQARHNYNLATMAGILYLSDRPMFEGQSGDYSGLLPSGRISPDFLAHYLYFSSLVESRRGEAIRQARAYNQSVWAAAFVYLWAQKRSADLPFFAHRSSGADLALGNAMWFVLPDYETNGRAFLRAGVLYAF
ncbi:MAG: hypothetical protein HS115_09865 [Spirochaetales bacterium]|nr:hypothetical protein [Spirochaetales bacterium]